MLRYLGYKYKVILMTTQIYKISKALIAVSKIDSSF